MQAGGSQHMQQLQDLQKKISFDDPINILFTSVSDAQSLFSSHRGWMVYLFLACKRYFNNNCYKILNDLLQVH